MIHYIFTLNELEEFVGFVRTPKNLEDQKAIDNLHDYVDTAANLRQIRLIIVLSPVVKSKDKTYEIWKNEKHDLMAHENAEGVRH